jgi:hypothetical protein
MILFCKTTQKDFGNLLVLLGSIEKHNRDNLKLYIAMPEKFISEIKIENIDYELIPENDIIDLSNARINGWHKQQIIKFEFCRKMSSEDCLIIDSDAFFIKDFYKSDFYNSDGNLYTVMHRLEKVIEDYEYVGKPLDKDLDKYRSSRKKIKDIFRDTGDLYEFGPSPILWSKKVIQDFYDNYLIKNNKTFEDIIVEAPLEYNWYGEWLLQNETIDLIPISPLFKNIFSQEEYDKMMELEITLDDLMMDYFGVNMNLKNRLLY